MNLVTAVIAEHAPGLVPAVGWALVLFLVQGALIGLTVAALLRALATRSPDLRYGVACAGLLIMAIAPLVTTVRGLTRGRAARTEPVPIARMTLPANNQQPRRTTATTEVT